MAYAADSISTHSRQAEAADGAEGDDLLEMDRRAAFSRPLAQIAAAGWHPPPGVRVCFADRVAVAHAVYELGVISLNAGDDLFRDDLGFEGGRPHRPQVRQNRCPGLPHLTLIERVELN